MLVHRAGVIRAHNIYDLIYSNVSDLLHMDGGETPPSQRDKITNKTEVQVATLHTKTNSNGRTTGIIFMKTLFWGQSRVYYQKTGDVEAHFCPLKNFDEFPINYMYSFIYCFIGFPQLQPWAMIHARGLSGIAPVEIAPLEHEKAILDFFA